MAHVRQTLGVAERRACRVLSQPRSTQRYRARVPDDEAELVHRMTELATEYGRYGYRRITALLRREGWHVNPKRIERLWRREGLKVPQRQPKRGRLWLTDGSCVRRRPEHKDHVWSYDFVLECTHDGKAVRALVVVDEYTRECLATRVARRLGSEDVIGKMRDELLNGEIFYTLAEAQVLIERWRREYNQVRPHSSLGYRPPAPEAIEWPLGATRQPSPVMNDFLT